MPDWSKSMQQTFEYYVVDPGTWRDKSLIRDVKSCEITRDEEAETLGSATISLSNSIGECYIRAYLITIQKGVREKFPLATFLVQTPSTGFDGKAFDNSLDAYTPLLELKDNLPPIGYYTPENDNIMENVYLLTREYARAPASRVKCDEVLNFDFVANTSDTWLTYIRDLMKNAKYKFDLDANGRIMFAPEQDIAALRPVWTYKDDNSSILSPDITLDHDLYGIPNVVEVIYSDGTKRFYAKVVNDDPNSPISTVNRGREITHRVTDPSLTGTASQERIEEYATSLLKALSTLEYTITYTHGYCPVRVGDCVRLDYSRAGLNGIKAKVVQQTITCETSCQVTEKAVFTKKLWGDGI